MLRDGAFSPSSWNCAFLLCGCHDLEQQTNNQFFFSLALRTFHSSLYTFSIRNTSSPTQISTITTQTQTISPAMRFYN